MYRIRCPSVALDVHVHLLPPHAKRKIIVYIYICNKIIKAIVKK